MEEVNLPEVLSEKLSVDRAHNALHQSVSAIIIATVGYIAGATSIKGIVNVWSDLFLRSLYDWLPIPDDSNLGRVFKLFKDRHIHLFEELACDLRAKVLEQFFSPVIAQLNSTKHLLVDMDSTVKTVFGNQEGAKKGYNPHKKGAKSHHPLLAFCAITKTILLAWNRSGDAFTSNGAIHFVSQLMANLGEGIRPFFRADSGFFSGEFLDFLELKKYGYLIKVKLKNLEKIMLGQQLWKPVPGQDDWDECSFEYSCNGWLKARTFHVVRVKVGEKSINDGLFKGEVLEEYEYFCYVCSDESLTPWLIHKKYGRRSTSENWIKEGKSQMALGHIKSDSFLATSSLFHCSILAFNILRWMSIISGSKKLFKWQLGTIRTFMIRVGGRLIRHSRYLELKCFSKNLFDKELRIWMNLFSSNKTYSFF